MLAYGPPMTDVVDDGPPPQRRRTVWLAVGAVVVAAVAVGAFVVSQGDDSPDGSTGSGGSPSSSTTTEPPDPTTTEPTTSTTGDGPELSSCPPPPQPDPAPSGPDDLVFRSVLVTAPPGACDDVPGWLEDDEGSSYQLGPAAAPGMVESAEARIDTTNGDWLIALTLNEGRPGIDDFNDLAAECSAMGPGCPTGQIAIVVGDEVVMAPVIQASAFERDEIQITGQYTKDEAEELADRIG
jgi:hypothetical protein